MPWILQANTSDQRELCWTPINPDGSPANFGSDYRSTFVPDESILPLHYRQVTKHKSIPDFVVGHGTTMIFVNMKMRKLIEDWDTETHKFFPVTLHLYDGRVLEGEYFMFKFGSFVDGVLAADSEVRPSIFDGELAFYSTSPKPKITWRKKSISGRHVWADTYLRSRFCVSDEFYAEVKSLGIKAFNAIEGFQK